MTEVEKGILKVIIYLDIFNFPSTLFEVWKYFYSPSPSRELRRINSFGQEISLLGIKEALEKSKVLNDFIESQNGFYFLKGRGDIIKTRLERYNIAGRKFRKAKRISKILSLIPFVKLIAVCNTLGYSNASEESDIDLFIITQRKRIWTVRFWSLLILEIFGLRPQKDKMKDKICLSFFVSDDHLNLEDLTLKPEDIYFNYWLNQLTPIYEFENIYSKFIQANEWVKKFLPNSLTYKINWRREVRLGFMARTIKRLEEIICYLIPETIFKKIQLIALPSSLKRLANFDTRIVVTDQVLKFHANDRREEFKRNFEARVRKYEL